MRDFIRADAWIGLCDLIDELGGDSGYVLKASGLSAEDLLPVDRYLPMSKFIATLRFAATSTGRKDFGLQLGLRRQLTDIGVVGLALENGNDWRSIIHVAQRIGHIANPLVTYALEPGPKVGTEFIWVDDSAARVKDREQGIERTVAFIVTSARRMVRSDFVPIAVQFAHQRIAEPQAYSDALGVVPTFGQPKTGLVVATEDLDRAIPTRSQEMSRLALAYLEERAPASETGLLGAAQLSARALVELRASDANSLARTLGMELRTLQRHLKKEGASVDGVLDDARKSLVERLLKDGVHSNAQIAHALGYASPATLTRNCKRWFGDTPANLRDRMSSHPDGFTGVVLD